MSFIFLDEEQRLLKQPVEIWDVTLNYCLEPEPDGWASLKVIRRVFAVVSKAFNELIKKVLMKQIHPKRIHIASYISNYGYSSLLKYAIEHGLHIPTEASSIAAQNGHLDCLQVLVDLRRCKLYPALIDEAATKGQLHVVQYLMGKGLRPDSQAIKCAVASGRVDLLQFLQDHIRLQVYNDIGLAAAESGSLAMVKYIEQYAPLESRNILGSAQNGSTDILKHYIDRGFKLDNPRICLIAANKGYFEYVKLAIDHGAALSEELMQCFAKKNDVEFMKELRARGCLWNGAAIKEAAIYGCFEALKYLVESGCPWEGALGEAATASAARGNHIRCVKYLMEHGAPWPIDIIDKTDDLATVKYLHERGCTWSANTTANAARGRFELLKYLHENKCPWDERVCIEAAAASRHPQQFNCLKYALDHGCPFESKAMTAVAISGTIDMLKLVVEKGLPWNSDTCSLVMRRGNYELLKYVHENGAQWTSDTVTYGLQSYSSTMYQCFKYAIDNGCPWDSKVALAKAKEYLHKEIVEWIQKNGMNN